jgi:hypothetical protein
MNLQKKISISKQEAFSFFHGHLPLACQNNFCHIIWISKSTLKVSPTIMSLFKRLGMILVMKKNSINQNNNIRMFTTSISRCLKKKKMQKHFAYFQVLELIFQATTNFSPNSSTCKYF